jgi:hypothetical protein
MASESNDKYAHCLMSCCLSVDWGPGVTMCGGIGREIINDWWLGRGTPSFADVLANAVGCSAYELFLRESHNASREDIVAACRLACGQEFSPK